MVVSLLEPEEEAQLILKDEAAAAAESGIEFSSFPIPDRGVPSSREAVATLASGIADALAAGRNVAVHCRQGVGRSAMIVGAALVAAGETPEAALKRITEARGADVPDTEEQRRWLSDFASRLFATPSAQAAAIAERRWQRLTG